MSKMSRQERLAYEQALKKRKKQGSSTKKRNSSSSRNTTRTSGRRSRSRYTDYDGNEIDENDIRNRRSSRYIDYDSYDCSRGYDTYDDYDDYDSYGYDDYNDYDDDDYEYEERPRRTRMPEDLGFGTRKRRSSSSGYRGREPGPAGGETFQKITWQTDFSDSDDCDGGLSGNSSLFRNDPVDISGGSGSRAACAGASDFSDAERIPEKEVPGRHSGAADQCSAVACVLLYV